LHHGTFDATWDKIVWRHHKFAGEKDVPNRSVMDADWARVIRKHESIVREREEKTKSESSDEDKEDCQEKDNGADGPQAAPVLQRQLEEERSALQVKQSPALQFSHMVGYLCAAVGA